MIKIDYNKTLYNFRFVVIIFLWGCRMLEWEICADTLTNARRACRGKVIKKYGFNTLTTTRIIYKDKKEVF